MLKHKHKPPEAFVFCSAIQAFHSIGRLMTAFAPCGIFCANSAFPPCAMAIHHMQAKDVRSIFAGLGGIHSRQHSRWVAAAVIGHCQAKAATRRFGAHGDAHPAGIVADAVVQ